MAGKGNAENKQGGTVFLPYKVTASEAGLLLKALARLKERRFGRLTVSVSDGRIVDMEVLEKIDRNLFRSFPP